MHEAAWGAKLRRRVRNAGSQGTVRWRCIPSVHNPPPPCSASAILAPASWYRLTASLLFRLFPGLCWLVTMYVERHMSVPVVGMPSWVLETDAWHLTTRIQLLLPACKRTAKPKAPPSRLMLMLMLMLMQFRSSQDATTIWRRDRPPWLALRPEGATERAKGPISSTKSRKRSVSSLHFYFHPALASDCATLDAARCG